MTAFAPEAPTTDDTHGDPLRDALIDAVGEEYEIVRLIGRGGMGAVYLARDRALERLVAIKVLPPGSATDSGVLERFRREAKTVASLQHVGIVPLYAFGERRGLCWFVMGYVRGESLGTRLERETMIDVETTRTLLAQVADALDHAHRQGIVHRDIKPDNILIDDSTGRAMLTDFGIARADSLQAGTNLTQVGSVMGTPHYMSPEQATSEPTIDGRSDLYSVGVAAYQMLSGRLPFDGRSFRELLMQHISVTPQPLQTLAPSVPADLAEAVMRCLEKDPAKRFSDGRSLRSAVGGSAYDDETLSYELTELQHTVARFLVTGVICSAIALSVHFAGGRLFTLPSWMFLTPLLIFPFYGFQVRDAMKRGYEWKTVRRVLTLPPKWWWFWWPKNWRRAGDVYEQLPSSLKFTRWLVTGLLLLTAMEFPLLAWASLGQQTSLQTLVPSAHAVYSVRGLAALEGLPSFAVVMAFLAVLLVLIALSQITLRRATRGLGLGYMDRQRLTYKPTDSSFWRDPRIQQVFRRDRAEQRPRTPTEFVSQILATLGTLPPAASETGSSAASAARRLLDAMNAHERELALLEKAAPREQLERLEAEIVVHESEAGDPEAVQLLVNQRDALLRSRERMQLVAARRDEAAARLESLWKATRKLATTTDASQSQTVGLSISDIWRDVERDYPVRRATATTQRSTASRLGLALAASVTLFLQPAAAPTDSAEAFLRRGQPDSALVVLAARTDSSAETLALTGRAYLQTVNRRGFKARLGGAWRSRSAFRAALLRDSTRVESLESMAWMARLVPPIAGGNRDEAAGYVRRLDSVAPYRGALLRGYFARLDRDPFTADSIFRHLVSTAPDSAPAWFALGDMSYRAGNADAARDALKRYAELMPTDRSALFHRGTLAAVHGVDLVEGEAALREYIKGPILPTEPTVDVAWWRLGQVLEKRAKLTDAREAYRTAVRLDGRDEDFKASLRNLEGNRLPR